MRRERKISTWKIYCNNHLRMEMNETLEVFGLNIRRVRNAFDF